jgi:TorA maturation chaperone TorD
MIPFENQKILWQTLSRSLVMPDEEWFGTMGELLNELRTKPWGEEMSRALEKWGASLDELKSEPLEEVQYEYTRLFVNGYPKTACPPYESVYREGTMLGESAMDVYLIYRDWGVEVDENEAGDHLAAMLEFLYYLNMVRGIADDDEKLRDVEDAIEGFWKDHLKPWVPQFAGDLVENASMPFYVQLGRVLAKVCTLMDAD